MNLNKKRRDTGETKSKGFEKHKAKRWKNLAKKDGGFMIDLTLLINISEQVSNLSTLPFGAEFGFNGNILETNVINLAVVIGIVVFLGGNSLRSLLENRKQTILNSLQEADSRAQEGKEKLSKAKSQLFVAQKKSTEIQEEASITADQEKKEFISQTQEDTQRLEKGKQETLQMEEQKTISQVSQQVVSLALNKARDKLKKRVGTEVHSSVNNFNIVLFRKHKVH